MNTLMSIKPLIDPTIKQLTQKSLDKLYCILIALRRIRKSWSKFFDDFVSFLEKMEKQDPDLFLYHPFINYLSQKLECEPFNSLISFLERNGYSEEILFSTLTNKTYNEGAFINRLSKNNPWFLWICIFYLYEPRLTQKFFWDRLEYLDKDEETIITSYRKLSPTLQEKVCEYTQKLATAENLSLKKVHPIEEN